MSLVKCINSPFNSWYLDAGTLDGDVDTLLADWMMLLEEGQKLGLVINVAKCELITNEDAVVAKFKAVAPAIKHVN